MNNLPDRKYTGGFTVNRDYKDTDSVKQELNTKYGVSAKTEKNYEKMWNEVKRELEDLETHYTKLREYHAWQGHPITATKFKERGDGVGEALMYMELAEDSNEFELMIDKAMRGI